MCKPHKHAEVIKAWADGKCIQQRVANGEWCDGVGLYPSWHEGFEYRIKPEVIKYKRFLLESLDHNKMVGIVTFHSQSIDPRETWRRFIRWIDNDWIEQEV